ncbi:MAG TPA: TolC family protein [Bryobacteraceae bacterium]|nr:TolC family protein [Bryobacteraceae bacterium]
MKKNFTALFMLGAALCMAANPSPERGPLRISLKRAVELALSPEGNAHIQLSQELVKQAKARSVQARAALLPDLEGSFGYESETRNLATMGLDQVQLPFQIRIPRMVGPFDLMDARTTVVQSVFDMSSIRRLQASHAGVGAAKAELENTDDLVTARVAKAYMAGLRAVAELEAVNANVALAEAVLKQAQNQKTAGSGTGIEVTRARVELLNQKQRRLVSENNRNKARLELLRAMGLRLDTDVELTDKLAYAPVDTAAFEHAKEEAEKSRADLKAQMSREDAARLSASATRMERLPSVASFADYGTTGAGPGSSLPTRTYGIAVRVPVFDGFRRDARREESNSIYREEKIKTNDLKDQIELDVQLSIDSMRSAEEQVSVATEALTLAESELTQARRRYDAGVTSGLEVTDAQTRLARARDNHIAALFNFNLSRLEYGQATGTIRSMLE